MRDAEKSRSADRLFSHLGIGDSFREILRNDTSPIDTPNAWTAPASPRYHRPRVPPREMCAKTKLYHTRSSCSPRTSSSPSQTSSQSRQGAMSLTPLSALSNLSLSFSPPRRSCLSSLLRTDPPPLCGLRGQAAAAVNWHGLLSNTPRAPEGLAEMPEEPQKAMCCATLHVSPEIGINRDTFPSIYAESIWTLHLFLYYPSIRRLSLQRLPSNPLSASLSPRESRISRLTGPEIPAAH